MKENKKKKKQWSKPSVQCLKFNQTLSGTVGGLAEGSYTAAQQRSGSES